MNNLPQMHYLEIWRYPNAEPSVTAHWHPTAAAKLGHKHLAAHPNDRVRIVYRGQARELGKDG